MVNLDIIILIPILWGAFKGFRNGLISEFAQFAGLVLGFLIAFKVSHLLSSWLITNWNIPEKYVSTLSFTLMFIGVLILVYILSKILEKLIKAISLEWVNKLGGLTVGVVKYLLIIGIVLKFIINLDPNEKLIKPETKQNSLILQPALYTAGFLSPYIKDALFINKVTKNDSEQIIHQD